MLAKKINVRLEFGSFAELEYTLSWVSAGESGVRLCALHEKGGVLQATIQFPSQRAPAIAFALGLFRARWRQLVREGQLPSGIRGDGSGLEKYLGACEEAETLFEGSAVETYLNFYDADAVRPTLSRFHEETPFSAEVLSEEEDTGGYVVQLRIASVDPDSLVVLGEIFAEEYEKVC